MEPDKTIIAFSKLGRLLQVYVDQGKRAAEKDLLEKKRLDKLDRAVVLAMEKNGWFTAEHIRYALKAWSSLLDEKNLEKWLSGYRKRMTGMKYPVTVGVVMAGNIPLVGFHDFLCVMMSGHRFLGRLSSDDTELLPCLLEILAGYEPAFIQQADITTKTLWGFDAVIATGSDNTAAHFEYYFRKVPSLIRRNRNSVAVLDGDESNEELSGLADDVFLYFGLGCRNVSKLYLPGEYDPGRLKEPFDRYAHFFHHHKYRNNYDYYKSVFLVNREPVTDTGFLLLRRLEDLSSPVSVLHYEYYSSKQEVFDRLKEQSGRIQCIVSRRGAPFRGCLPGRAQQAVLEDYADGLDTMDFLLCLEKKN
jgi:hypothetical protein